MTLLTCQRYLADGKYPSTNWGNLRPSLPEDQAGVMHAISPIWMKLFQIEGTTKQL